MNPMAMIMQMMNGRKTHNKSKEKGTSIDNVKSSILCILTHENRR